MNLITSQVLKWVLPMILGPVVYYLGRYLLNVSDKVDDLPPAVKRVAIVAIAGALTSGLAWLHIDVPSECSALVNVSADVMAGAAHACAAALNTKVPLQALTAAAVAFVLHSLKKSRPTT